MQTPPIEDMCSSGPQDASAYPGDSSLVTVGTIASGVWQGTAVADNYVANELTIDGGFSCMTI